VVEDPDSEERVNKKKVRLDYMKLEREEKTSYAANGALPEG
jgi:hypothetical protein